MKPQGLSESGAGQHLGMRVFRHNLARLIEATLTGPGLYVTDDWTTYACFLLHSDCP